MAEAHPYQITSLGDAALLVQFGNTIDEGINQKVLQLFRKLQALQLPYITDVVPAYSSLAVYYDVYQLLQKEKGFKAFFAQFLNRATVPKHKAEAYLQKAASLHVQHDGGGLDFIIPKKEEVPFADIPASHHAGFIAIALSGTENFQWPLYLLQQLCMVIQHPIILLGTEKERPLAQKAAGVDNIKIYNACGKFSLLETADLVRKSKLLIAFQPYYLQLSAAFSKAMVMLALSQKDDAPYYSPHFLKKSTTPPYDRIQLPKSILKGSNTVTDEKVQAEMEKTAAEIWAKAANRLKSKA